MSTQHGHTTTHTCAPTATHTTHRHTWTRVFTPHGRPECPHSWHTAFPGTNWLRGSLCWFERKRTLGRGGGAGGTWRQGGAQALAGARLSGAGAGGWPGTGDAPRGGSALSPRQSLGGADKEGPSAQASIGAPRRKEPYRACSSSPGASEGNSSPGEPGSPHRQSPVWEQTQPLCARVQAEQGITAQAPGACCQAPSSLGNGVTEGSRGVKNPGMRMQPRAGGSTGLRPRRAAQTQFR